QRARTQAGAGDSGVDPYPLRVRRGARPGRSNWLPGMAGAGSPYKGRPQRGTKRIGDAAMNQNARPVDDRALRFAWGEYRRASKQAREMKRELNRRRLISLGLGVAGAIFGVLAAQFGDWAGGSSLPDRLPQ